MNNSILLEVKFLGPTNTKPARYKITNYDLDKNGVSKTLSYGSESKENSQDEVISVITKSGFKILTMNCRRESLDVFMCKWDWSTLETFFKKGV